MDNPAKAKGPPTNASKAFDVFRPGKTAASATSRPVIVGHQPKAHDSTLTDKPSGSTNGPLDHRLLLDAHDKVALEPVQRSNADLIAFAVERAEPQALDATPQELTVPTDINHSQTEVATGSEPPAANEPAPQAQISDTEPVPKVTQPTVAESSAEPSTDQKAAASVLLAYSPQPMNDQPIISHHDVHRNWVKPLAIIVLVLGLGLLAFDVILDAGLIKTTVIPHTHFLK